MRPERLYRFFDADGRLLYVGITANLPKRLEKHSLREWWESVANMTVTPYATREEVRAAERVAIETERPLHNIRMNRAVVGRERPALSRATGRPLVWFCSACALPIADDQGYVHVKNRDVHVHESWRQRSERERAQGSSWAPADLSELLRAPERARWAAHHRDCDPEPGGSDYWFDVDRARTAHHLLDWTLHLSEKCWLEDTDWSDFIRTALAANNAQVDA